MHNGATRQARPLQLRGRARDKRTEAIQQSHLGQESEIETSEKSGKFV